MTPERYFTRPNPGCFLPRFFVLHATRNAFVRVQVSRPDGIEIREPAGVRDERPAPASNGAVRPAFDRGGQFRIVARARVRAEGHAICSKCRQVKPIADFPANAAAVNGASSWCRLCKNAAHQASRQRVRAGVERRP